MCVPEILEWQHKSLHCDFEMGKGKSLEKTLGITTDTTLLKSVLHDKASPAIKNCGTVQKLTSPHWSGAAKKECKLIIIWIYISTAFRDNISEPEFSVNSCTSFWEKIAIQLCLKLFTKALLG